MNGLPLLDGRRRVVSENVQAEINSGRFPIKRVIGQNLKVGNDHGNIDSSPQTVKASPTGKRKL